MRVIFLDIDGVLNSEAFALKLEEKHRHLGHTSDTSCACFMLYSQMRGLVSRRSCTRWWKARGISIDRANRA